MTTNGKTLLVYESMSFIKAIQWCKDHLIMIKNHNDISKLIQGIIGTIMWVSFYGIVFWEKQHIFLTQMPEIRHEGYDTYNKHESSQKTSKIWLLPH